MREKFNAVIIMFLTCLLLVGCVKSENDVTSSANDLQKIGQMDLSYAREFSIDYYDGGYSLIKISDNHKYVLVPQGAEDNNLGFKDAVIIRQPESGIYLAASSVMDLFRQLGAIDMIKSCSTRAEDYCIAEAREKIERGDIVYVGKYSAPDYEKLLSLDTELAIESTMIYHNPRVKEELESFKIPVLVDHSSYEAEPLGRLEWIKLYGLLTGKLYEAEAFFDEQMGNLRAIANESDDVQASSDNPQTTVFFYVTSNGYVNIRKPDDYIPKMIELAGGSYALSDIEVVEDNALGTMNISWEDFYVYAKDADILIYNSTVNDGIKSTENLVEMNPVFADFKAVREKNVFCSTNNMYQETSKIADIIVELKAILDGKYDGMKYITYVGE